MKINPAFPPSRLKDPQRRAERDIYTAIEASPIPGRALYEVKVDRDAKQVDILLWAEAITTFAVELKGGIYVIRDGELCLVTDQGVFPMPGLLAKVWDASRAIPAFIQGKLPTVGCTSSRSPGSPIRSRMRPSGTWQPGGRWRFSLERKTGWGGWLTWPAATPSGTGPPRRPSSRR